jgi:hypothetical protein
MKRSLGLLCLIILLINSGCMPAIENEFDQPINILFIGNSYTFMNDLPGIFAELAKLGGQQANVGMFAKPGYSLLDHAQDPELEQVITDQDWDIVIIQEKSDLPVINRDLMVQGLQRIDEMLASQDQRVILFMPWAYQSGFPDAELENYREMQTKVAEAYYLTGEELEVDVAPVGIAWQSALQEKPELKLWAEDGRHPTRLGSFLAANVFYALVFNQDPAEIHFPSEEENQDMVQKFLQLTAAGAVPDL